jgi:hypothetical protein
LPADIAYCIYIPFQPTVFYSIPTEIIIPIIIIIIIVIIIYHHHHHHHYGFELFLCERSVTDLYLLQSAQTGTGAYAAFYSVGTGVYLQGVKWRLRVVDHPPQSSVEVRN